MLRNLKRTSFLFFFLFTFLSILMLQVSMLAAEEPPSVYIVKEGDTLWGISHQYFQDPLFWPNLWEMNKHIRDPQWIYPGQPLLLQKKEIIAEPNEPNEDLEHSVKVVKVNAPGLEPPLTPPPPPFPTAQQSSGFIIDGDQIESCGYILTKAELSQREEQEQWGTIIDAKENKISFSYTDLLYINKGREETSKGDLFTVFRTAETVSHPTTNKNLGYIIHVLGLLQVEEVLEKIALVKIVKSFTEIHLNDRLSLYQKSPWPGLIKPSESIEGTIIAGKDGRINLAANNIVFLDAGRKQHLQPGHAFTIYRQDLIAEGKKQKEDEQPMQVNDLLGELIILRAEANTSTALITKSKDAIFIGDRFFTQP